MHKELPLHILIITLSLLSFSEKEKPKPSTVKARDSKNQSSLDDAQCRAAREAGFIKKNKTAYSDPGLWRTMLEEWPLRSVCRLYATKNFTYKHGVCGKHNEGCRHTHKPWKDLSADNQSKVRTWAAKYSETFSVVES